MNKRIGYIYGHRNKINGKWYIGKTVQNPKRRWRKALSAYKNCKAFYNAILSHGWENFESEVLLSVIDVEKINDIEGELIKQYNSIAPNGYNLKTQDNGLIIYSDELKEKIRIARAKYLSELKSPLKAWNKKEHIIIEGVAHKQCTFCKDLKELDSFCTYSSQWDKKHIYCLTCCSEYVKKYRPMKTLLTEEQIKESYINRKEKMREGIINSYKNNPNLKKQISESKKRPLKAVHIETGETLYFTSGLDAKAKGFSNTNLGQAIKFGKPYKGYMWSKVEKIQLKNEDEKYTIFDHEKNSPSKMKIWESILNTEKNVIYARKCQVKIIDVPKTHRSFLVENHLQGYTPASHVFGLFHENELVAMMTFGKPRYNKNYEWELLRFCSKLNTRIVGGASKLLTYFVKTMKPKSLLSYANKRFSQGNLYEKLGFKKISESSPNYFYEKNGIIYSRVAFQKHKLKNKLTNFDPLKTERQNMLDNGYKVIQDKGNLVYVLEFNN